MEDEEEENGESDHNEAFTRNVKDIKRSENQNVSKSSLELLFPCGKPLMPLIPPVVQVLSPGASTPKKSFSSDEYIINSTNNNNNTDQNLVSLLGDIYALTDKVCKNVLEMKSKNI